MSRGYRPKRATGKGDANHWMVRDFLRDVCGGFEDNKIGSYVCYCANFRGLNAWAIDTSGLGGLYLDWIVGIESLQAWVEIKTPEAFRLPNNGLRPGERWTLDNLKIGKVVMSDDDVARVFSDLADKYQGIK